MDSLMIVDSELLDFLKISLDRDEFTFYRIERKGQEEYWDIIGVSYVNTSEMVYDIVLLHIDAEQLLWDDFVAEDEESGRIQCTPQEYLKIIRFFEHLLGKEMQDPHRLLSRFTPLNEKELLDYHYPPYLVHSASDCYYRYFSAGRDAEKINIVSCPSWLPHRGENQVSSIDFRTFFTEQLADSQFNPVFDTTGFGIITFDQVALEEFICLLKRHVFQPI